MTFLGDLFGECDPNALLGLWTRTDGARWWPVAEAGPAQAWAEEVGGERDVWVRVSTVAREPLSGRGTEADAVQVPALWLDLDLRGEDPAHAKYLPRAAALDLVEQFATEWARPTEVVESGSGLHLWWRLTEPMGTDAKGLVRGLQRWWQERAQALGCVVDGTADLARLMRIPGTVNHKGAKPRPVRLVETRPGAWVRAEDLAGLATTVVAVPEGEPEDVVAPWERVKLPLMGLLAEEPELGERSEHAYRVVSEARAEGLTASETLAVVLDAERGLERAREQGRERTWRDVQRIYARAEEAEAEAKAEVESYRAELEGLLPEGTEVPPGWELSAAGVTKLNPRSSLRVLAVPLVVERIMQGAETGAEHVALRWEDGGPCRVTVARQDVAEARSIVRTLAPYGCPVDSTNAAGVVAWLTEFGAHNRHKLPRSTVSARLGWHRGGFLLPDRCLGRELEFAAVAGEGQLARSVRAAGEWETWAEAVARLAPYPRVMLAVYTALAAPLVLPASAPNITVEWAGPTSRGKSTALRVAASVWGSHDERDGGLMLTWDTTRVAVERSAAVLCDLPLIVDETQRARSLAEVASVIYDVASGRGRGRGSIEGLREATHARTVMLTSGEVPVTSASRAGGLARRVLTLWGPPFGEASEAVGTLAVQVTEALRTHHGHAGPRFVEALQAAYGDRLDVVRDRYQAHADALRAEATGGTDPGVLVGLAQAVALLRLTGELAHELLPLPWEWQDPTAAVWAGLTAEVAADDRPKAALEAVVAWAAARASSFAGRRGGDDYAPPGGWLGRWEPEGDLCLTSGALRAALVDAGYEGPEGLQRQWRDLGWLDTAEDGRSTRVRKLCGQAVRLVCIRAEALDL